MAKKKPNKETDMPAAKAEAPADRHKSRNMVRLPPRYHRHLMELARRNNRPASWELRLALERHFQATGFPLSSTDPPKS